MLTIDLSGRTALVTGGGQGIGLAISRTLAEAGATVLVNDLVPARAEEAAASIEGARPLAFDVTSFDGALAAVGSAGPVDILVNNAGNAGGAGWTLKPVADTTPADWEPYLRVNLYGVMHCTRAALPGMIEAGWGRVVTITSDSGRTGDATLAAYAAAKAGAAAFCRSVAREVGRYGITVNCLALGTMRTPSTGMDREERDDPALAALLKNYVIRRRGEPEDVAPMVALLASPLAAWITGQTIPVNGGYSMAI